MSIKKIKIRDICEFFTDGDWIESSDQSATGIRLIQTGNIGNGFYKDKETKAKYISEVTFDRLNCTEVKTGDILISRLPDPIGRACRVPLLTTKSITAVDCSILRLKSMVDANYFVFYTQSSSYQKQIEKYINGATRKRISRGNLAEIEIPLYPLEKQQRITTELTYISDIIGKHKELLDKYDALIKSRFIEMTENSKTELIRMGDIASYINGYAFKPEDWSNTGKKIIRIQNLNDKKASYNHYEGTIDEKYLVKENDILVSWATHLEAYIWDGEDSWLNQHIFKVVFDKREINKIYFVYSTEEALRIAFRNAHGFKPTMEHIKRADFENAEVKLPNLIVQNEFAAFVQQIDKSKFAVQKSLEKAETLYKSLMQEYFG